MSITAHTVLFLLVLASFGCNESDLPDLEQQLNTLEQELVVATKRVEELELHLATTEETASKFIAVQEKLNGEIKDLKQRIESISATNEEAAKKLAIRMDDLVRHAAVMDEKIAAFAGRPPGEPPQVKQAPPRPVIRSSYFYDMDAKKLFMAEANMIPPIDAPSGGKAVIAHVFACDSCANNQDMFIG